MQNHDVQATQELIDLIGKSVIKAGQDEFIALLEKALKRGADVNVRLPGNDKVQKGETALDYYVRREQLYLAEGEKEKYTERADAFGESIFAVNAGIARDIAETLKKHGAKRAYKAQLVSEVAHAQYTTMDTIDAIVKEIRSPLFFSTRKSSEFAVAPETLPRLSEEMFPEISVKDHPDFVRLGITTFGEGPGRRTTVRELFYGTILAQMETRLAEIIIGISQGLPGEKRQSDSPDGDIRRERNALEVARLAASLYHGGWNENQAMVDFNKTARAYTNWLDEHVKEKLNGNGLEITLPRRTVAGKA